MEIMDRLMELESSVAELYGKYGRLFPEHEAFWHKIAEQEVQHARLVSALFKGADTGKLEFNEKRIPLPLIVKEIEFIKEKIQEADRKDATLKSALEAAYMIENSMVEKGFYAPFTGQSIKIADILSTIMTETNEHREKIGALLKGVK